MNTRISNFEAWLGTLEASADPDSQLLALKDESERLLVINITAAARLADALVEAADRLDRPLLKALGWMAQGDVRRAQGRYPEAVALYEAGGQACLDLGDEIGWARSRTGWVFAAQFCGRGREALPVAELAYTVLARAGEHLRAGGLSNNMAGVYYQLGEYKRALEIFDRAITHFEQVGRSATDVSPLADERIARAKANKSLTLALLGRFPEAVALSQEARDIFIRHGEVAAALRADQYRASIYAGQGRYTQALRVQTDALESFEQGGLSEAAIQVSLDMIASYAGLNRHAEALAVAEGLARRCQAIGASTEAARARVRCAQALVALGRSDDALSILAEVDEALSAAGLTGDLGGVALLRARLHLEAEDWGAALEFADRAHQLFAERGMLERRTEAELLRSRALLMLGRTDDAETLAATALDTGALLDAVPLTHAAHHQLARIARTRRQTSRALDEFEAAIRDLEQVQSSLTTALRTEFLGDKLRVFQDAIEYCLRRGEFERAFNYLERAKSRAMVDYLASRPDVRVQSGTPAEQALIDQLAQLREQHAWFYSRLHGFGPVDHSSVPTEAEQAALREAVAQRERRIMQLNERLALLRDGVGLEALGQTAGASVMALPRLADGTLLLEYAFTDDLGAAFVVRPRGLEVVQLPLGGRALRQVLNRWQLNVEAAAAALRDRRPIEPLRRNALGQLEALHQALIEPVVSHLRGVARLVVVPFGPAHGVPFHALFDGRRHLTEEVELWTSPSSTLLDLCAQRSVSEPGQALVVAYSGGQLPYVLDEARTVSALLGATCYLESEATRGVVLTNASRRGILHLAAHGEARLDNPTFAHLTLADGQLGMADLVSLRLDGALVTLSGCETGRSAVVGGDELVGLSRGFLFAGASTLVQSLWRVDDESTARLMQIFYSALCAGQTPGTALRLAQRSFIDDGLHPYQWAAFQLVGYGGHIQRWVEPASTEVRLDATTGSANRS